MLKKGVLLTVFGSLALFSVTVLSGNIEKNSSEQTTYNTKVALLDTMKLEASQIFESPAEVMEPKGQLRNGNDDFVPTAAGFVLLTFGLIGFVMRASRPRI